MKGGLDGFERGLRFSSLSRKEGAKRAQRNSLVSFVDRCMRSRSLRKQFFVD